MGAFCTPRGPTESAAPSRWSRIGTTGSSFGDGVSPSPCCVPGPAPCAAPFASAWYRTLSRDRRRSHGVRDKGGHDELHSSTVRRDRRVVNGRNIAARSNPWQPAMFRDNPQCPATRFLRVVSLHGRRRRAHALTRSSRRHIENPSESIRANPRCSTTTGSIDSSASRRFPCRSRQPQPTMNIPK